MTETVPQNTPRSNVPEMTVSELSLSVKKTLESTYGHVRVRGELSRTKIVSSGHMYGALKDENAVIDIVCWRGVVSKLSVKNPEEGMEVIVTGRLSSYPARSNYQLIIESMELAGEGALLKLLEDRRKKLLAEGLFDEARKKPLPFLPDVIGVVTSPTGAVIRDIMHRLDGRFPRHVLLWPALVQGEGAAEQIAAAINGLDALPESGPIPKPDVLIVGRGGGSLEDLMPFNEEIVVRAIAACSIPVISAVGHETDTSLSDYAADQRAPTPTGAAEIAVPRRIDLYNSLQDNRHRITSLIDRLLTNAADRLENLSARLGDPGRILEIQTQTLDHTAQRLEAQTHRTIERGEGLIETLKARLIRPEALISIKEQSLGHLAHKLSGDFKNNLIQREHTLQRLKITPPKTALEAQQKDFDHLVERLPIIVSRILKEKLDRLESWTRMLETLSYESVLERGFVVVKDKNGNLLTKAAAAREQDTVTMLFHGDEGVDAAIIKDDGGKAEKHKARTGKKAPRKKGVSAKNKQQELF